MLDLTLVYWGNRDKKNIVLRKCVVLRIPQYQYFSALPSWKPECPHRFAPGYYNRLMFNILNKLGWRYTKLVVVGHRKNILSVINQMRYTAMKFGHKVKDGQRFRITLISIWSPNKTFCLLYFPSNFIKSSCLFAKTCFNKWLRLFTLYSIRATYHETICCSLRST